ncbi:MAG: hypothetical protein LBU80_04760, partial [Rikenellaceae bacterium]|nr:hypothetical protein [Rikenellaceae bacterium]
MQRKYPYRFGKRSKRITTIVTLLGVAVVVWASFHSISGFFPAWISMLLAAVVALYVLSIPRFVRIDDDFLEIHCLVELTKIHIEDIKTVEPLDREKMRSCIPLIGSYGFFGFYGYYCNLSEWELVKVYASGWENFIRIEDIYEDVYIINCDRRD